MSRSRIPLNQQKGNLTKEEITEKEYSEKKIVVGREQLEKPNSALFFNSVAKKEYQRVIREFDKIDVVGNLDLTNLIGYSNAFALYLKATKELAKAELLIENEENPLINIQKKYADEMRKFARLCGLTIDSRLKLAVYKTTEEKEIVNEDFGYI